jgi:hypothetical protein
MARSRRSRLTLTLTALALLTMALPSPAAARSLDLAALRNHKSICHDPTESCDFDGVGYGYHSLALALGGVEGGTAVKAHGLTYTWPSVPRGGAPDSVTAAGQRIAVDLGGGTRIGFLGAAHHGPVFTSVTLHYLATDAEGQQRAVAVQAPLVFSDWTLSGDTVSPAAGNAVAVKAPLRTFGPLLMPTSSYAFSAVVNVDPTMQLVAVELPRESRVRLFDIAVG